MFAGIPHQTAQVIAKNRRAERAQICHRIGLLDTRGKIFCPFQTPHQTAGLARGGGVGSDLASGVGLANARPFYISRDHPSDQTAGK